MIRKRIIAANWKMNMDFKSIDTYVDKLRNYMNDINFENKDVFISPPFVYLDYLKKKVKEIPVKIGAQNCFYEEKGAFTGEISPLMLKDLGLDFVIIGHSERRNIFNETDEILNKKLKKVLENKILTIFCIGEKLSERESDKTIEILSKQIDNAFMNINKDLLKNLIIAYEPVWAIGTGKNATIDQIKEVHSFIRKYLKKFVEINIPILYGGSVKPENIKDIMSLDVVDGVLVGGASLDMDKFIQIINFEE